MESNTQHAWMPARLRHLFIVLAMSGMTKTLAMLDAFAVEPSIDFYEDVKLRLPKPIHRPTSINDLHWEVRNRLLNSFRSIVIENGHTMTDFNLPEPTAFRRSTSCFRVCQTSPRRISLHRRPIRTRQIGMVAIDRKGGGSTIHSTWHITLEDDSQNMLRESDERAVDEVPMAHRHVYEAIHRGRFLLQFLLLLPPMSSTAASNQAHFGISLHACILIRSEMEQSMQSNRMPMVCGHQRLTKHSSTYPQT